MTPLIAGLLRPEAYSHPAPAPRLIETHISWVILAGDHAYKLKKPLDLGFLDFSTLDKRRACCEAEIRLNRRLAPHIYEAVVPVTGSPDEPRFGGEGPPLEWAVKMRAFPAEATLDREPAITPDQIDAIADQVAVFHDAIDVAPAESPYGLPEVVIAPVEANFAHLRSLSPPARALPLLERLETWSRAEGERLTTHFAARKAGGFIRECHGDLHLGNIAWIPDSPLPFSTGGMKNQGKPLIFDAIEFNPALRFIDVINEVAFLAMDLRHRGRDDLAWRCLNRYLEHGGDTTGLATLPYYQVYRAMVRAKVSAIRASQSDGDFGECLGYLDLADRLAHDRHPALILMHGVSGSGKTWYSQQMLEALGAVRLRSDVAGPRASRRRLHRPCRRHLHPARMAGTLRRPGRGTHPALVHRRRRGPA
jgi:aminoglycoside phosphotransferase family enzyme